MAEPTQTTGVLAQPSEELAAPTKTTQKRPQPAVAQPADVQSQQPAVVELRACQVAAGLGSI